VAAADIAGEAIGVRGVKTLRVSNNNAAPAEKPITKKRPTGV
jgi:hypothetical protein